MHIPPNIVPILVAIPVTAWLAFIYYDVVMKKQFFLKCQKELAAAAERLGLKVTRAKGSDTITTLRAKVDGYTVIINLERNTDVRATLQSSAKVILKQKLPFPDSLFNKGSDDGKSLRYELEEYREFSTGNETFDTFFPKRWAAENAAEYFDGDTPDVGPLVSFIKTVGAEIEYFELNDDSVYFMVKGSRVKDSKGYHGYVRSEFLERMLPELVEVMKFLDRIGGGRER